VGKYYGVYKIPKETSKEGLGKKADTYIKLITDLLNKGQLEENEVNSLENLKERLINLNGEREENYDKLIDDLNAAMAKEKFSLTAVGDSFEIALGVISEVLKGKALKEIDGLTKGIWTGEERSSVRIDSSKFQEGLLDEMRKSLDKAGHPRALPKVKNGEITFKAT
jgi:hypothetical protein